MPSLADVLFDEPGVGRCLVAPDGSVVRANAEWLRSTGLTLEEVLGADIVNLFPETRDVAMAMRASARAGNRVEVPRRSRMVDGHETWWEGSIAPVPMEGGPGLLITAREVGAAGLTELSQVAKPRLEWQNPVIASIAQMFEKTLTVESEEALGRACLGIAEEVTQSRFGFIGEINPRTGRLDDIAISDPGWDACRMQDAAGHGKRKVPTAFSIHGIYGRVLLDGASVLTNDPPSHPDSIGTPPGHPPLRAFLGVPLIHAGRTWGMLAVGNREGGYGPDDRAALEALAPAIVQAFLRKRAEDGLRASEAKLRAMFNALVEGVVFLNVDGKVEEANDATWRRHGHAERELQESATDPRHRIIRPDGTPFPVEEQPAIVALRTGQAVHDVEMGVPLADGSIRWRLVNAQPTYDAAGKLIGAVASFFDVTDRKRVEEALRESEQRSRRQAAELRAVLDAVPAGVFIARDPEARRIDANRAGLEMLRVGPGGNVSKSAPAKEAPTYRVLRDGLELPSEELPAQRAARGMEVRDWECEIRFEDGTSEHILGHATPLRDEAGTPAGSVTAFVDISERKRAEEALRVSEQRLVGILEAMPDAFVSFDADLRYTYVNANAERLQAACREALLGKDVRAVYPDAEACKTIQLYERAIREQKLVTSTSYHAGFDRWVEVRAFPTPGGVSAFYKDVSAQVKAEEALRESESRLRTLGDNLPEGAVYRYQHDGDGRPRFLFISKGIEQLTGVTPAEILRDARALHNTIHPEDRARLASEEARSRDSLTRFEMEVRERHRLTGEERWHLLRSVPTRLQDGTTTWDGIQVDITERRRAEAALRASEQRLGLAFDAARAAAWEVNLVTGKHFWEDRFFPLLSIPPEAQQEAQQRWNEFVLPEDQERAAKEFIASCAEGGPPYDSEFRAQRMDGVVRWFRSRGTQIRDPAGNRRMVGFVQDITEQKKAEQTLRQAIEQLREGDRRKTEFLAVLSHELRNPLAPIRNSIYLLECAAPGSNQATRAREVIRRQTEHLSRIVDDLLDVMRISRGKIELRRKRMDARKLIRQACDDHRVLFQERRLALRVDATDPVLIDADETRLAQVVGNLLQNAAKFSHEGGTVIASVGIVDGQAEIRVRDDGVGIPPDLLARLFVPFVQADGGLARTKGGLGLGLALVKSLVEMHGGSVHAHSEGLDRGAEFVVRLALAPAPEQTASDRARLATTTSVKILIIEDNVDAAQSMADVLELEGHRVHVAIDGRSGVAKAHEVKPDVILCDIGLPDVSGYDVAQSLRAENGLHAARLIALSGYAQSEDVQRAREAGFDAHIAKPPSLEALLALVAARV